MPVTTTENLVDNITLLKKFVVPKLLIRKIIRFVEQKGILAILPGLESFSLDDFCLRTESELGYTFQYPVCKRMIFNLLNILGQLGYIVKDGSLYHKQNSRFMEESDLNNEFESVEKYTSLFEGEICFFSNCIEYASDFMKGAPPLYRFSSEYGNAWESFLGNYEFNTVRKILLQSLGIRNDSSFRILDLCYGRGHSIELTRKHYPKTSITAIDFTHAFKNEAREKLETMQRTRCTPGTEILPVDWVHPNVWKGFGDRLPFEEKSFDLVLFSCSDPYIPADLRGNVYKDIYRVLKPGGGLGVITRCYPDTAKKYITNDWARMAIYIHDFAESVCENWRGFYGVDETMRLFVQLGFLSRPPFFEHYATLDYSLWGLERPVDG